MAQSRLLNLCYPLMFLMILSLDSCSLLKETSILSKCEFRISAYKDPKIAGIDVSQVNDMSDLGMLEMAKISTSILQGKLPLTFIMILEARNPNPATAALNRLEYIISIDDVQVADGAMEERVEIPPGGGLVEIPLQIHTDLIILLEKDTRTALINLGLNLSDAGNTSSRLIVKAKPVILIGKKEIKYPGYIRIRQEFGTEPAP